MKKATIYDVAKAAECSAMTVTRAFREGSVISPKTRERILREAERLNFVPSIAASRLSQPEILLSVALFDAVPELTAQQLQGFREVEDELRNLKVGISIHTFANRLELPAILDEIKAEEPGGLILMSDTVSDEARLKIEKLQENGVRLAVVVCPHDSLKPDVCVAVDAETSGKIAAQLLGGIGPCCVFIGNSEASLHRIALESFKNAAVKYQTRLREIYDTKENPQLSEAQVSSMLNGDIPAGVYISTANSDLIISELKKRGLTGKIRIICTDVLKHIEASLSDGDVYATLFSDPPYQVKTACRSLYRSITSDCAAPAFSAVRPQIVMSSNIDNYKRYF